MESALNLEATFGIHRNRDFRLDLAISIPPGKTVALLGPNGAGKSTAVAALAGLLPIERGVISLGEAVLDDPQRGVFVAPEDRRIGVVFQDYLLFPHLSVIDNVAFGLRSRGFDRRESTTMAEEYLARMGLRSLGSRKPSQLSGGEAQRIALARALIIQPDLLLLDEPLAALDVSTRGRLRRILADHLDVFAGPRLLITHDPTEAFVLADEIHVIENGAITQSGAADEIRLRPRSEYAADLAGSNLLAGFAHLGAVEVGSHRLQVASAEEGDVLLTIRPSAIALHRRQPEGSPRNSWLTTIDLIEPLDDRVRVRTGPPLPLTAEITTGALEDLGLAIGAAVWVAVKATEIGVQTNQGGLAEDTVS